MVKKCFQLIPGRAQGYRPTEYAFWKNNGGSLDIDHCHAIKPKASFQHIKNWGKDGERGKLCHEVAHTGIS